MATGTGAAVPPATDADDGDVIVLSNQKQEMVLAPLPEELMKEWRTNKPTFGRRHFMKYLLSSGLKADVTFVVNDEDEKPTKLKAHKSIVRFKSEFFAALFSERWKNPRNDEDLEEIDLTPTQLTSPVFKMFLEYLYFGQVTLTTSNVMEFYYISTMYQIDDLKILCENFLRANINEENVFTSFNAVLLHDTTRKSNVLNDLIAFLCRNGEAMLERSEFMEFKMDQLALIFSRDTFRSSDLKLLRFCLCWTKKHFGRKKLHNFKELDRLFCYDLQLKHWNYKLPELSGLLRWNEKFNEEILPPADPKTKYEVTRFQGKTKHRPWTYRRNYADRISFRVSEPILLTGIGLYGELRYEPSSYTYGMGMRLRTDNEDDPPKYNVKIRIYVHGKSHKELLTCYRRAGSNADMDSNTSMYKVEFNAIYLQPDEWYTVSVNISGPHSYSGESGVEGKVIRCGNVPVVVEFKEACSTDEEAKLSNATGLPIGQIPLLIFKLASSDEADDDIEVL